ncbi:hypothetical protein Q9Q95_02320 [Sphingomonas sp. DG1-23]|uniref:outer membrane protein n=1 Tax=Sphingomonas sp. DG1-23 TaxID=3068316 RepID=UPI00273FF57B|nr:hypothetical protein [Sphingomonas sp. DG1-23]MDP5277747.1 hypothetical protein [Sphingomonas sp. DG1-23]
MPHRALSFLFGASIASCPAQAQDGGFFATIGAENRTQKLAASGALLGSLAPVTPFDEETKGDRIDGTASLGYDLPIGGSLFLGIEASLGLGNLDQRLDARASATATQTVYICYPDPFAVGGCAGPPSISETTTVFDETQHLALNVRTGPSVALMARAGLRFGPTRIWGFGGVVRQRLHAAHDLPAVNTAIPPVYRYALGPPGVQILELAQRTTLPAEQVSETRRMTGSIVGVGLEQRITGRYSLVARYGYADYGETTFQSTARLAPVRIKSRSHTFSMALGARF